MIDCETVIEMKDNEILNMYFGIIEAPRCDVNVIHPLVDILKLVMIAVLCGMDELEYFTDYIAEWKSLNKIFALKREVERNGKRTTEISCYLSSKIQQQRIYCHIQENTGK